jgi:hypothetical protein
MLAERVAPVVGEPADHRDRLDQRRERQGRIGVFQEHESVARGRPRHGADIRRADDGSAGGWNVFGPVRRITRSEGNVLYELDGEPALDLYERYLGPEAEGLPGSGLLFPLQVFDGTNPDHKIVRTILAVDREQRSLTFAGDMPLGWQSQLMRGNFGRLADGAADAAAQATDGLPMDGEDGDGVALMISCIGRRLLMGQRIGDEVDAAAAVLGPGYRKMGFYAYGEISPHPLSRQCELHNQTMTITTLREAPRSQ